MSRSDAPLIVLVDGGGSTSRAAIATGDGDVLGRAMGGPANVTTDFDGALASLMATVNAAYTDARLDPSRQHNDVAFMGLAGANVSGTAKRMEQRLAFAQSKVISDREITVAGALGHHTGTVALFGTGSFFVARSATGLRSIGGWGFQLGDDYGGAWLGRKLLRRAVLAFDGLAISSDLTQQIIEEYGGSPDALVTFAQSASPSEYGRFAPRLVAAFEAGDETAKDIVKAASDGIVATLDAIGSDALDRLCMLGGLGSFYASQLPDRYSTMVTPALGDGLSGAITMAQAAFAKELA